MGLFKRCPVCHKRIPIGTKCGCKKTRREDRETVSDKRYHGKRWRELRELALMQSHGLDMLELERGKLIPAEVVHHIIPTKDDDKLFYDIDNLIPLAYTTHGEVHAGYDKSDKHKRIMQDKLENAKKSLRS